MKTVDVGSRCSTMGDWGGYQKALVAAAALAIVFDGLDNQVLSGAIPAIMTRLAGAALGADAGADAPVSSA